MGEWHISNYQPTKPTLGSGMNCIYQMTCTTKPCPHPIPCMFGKVTNHLYPSARHVSSTVQHSTAEMSRAVCHPDCLTTWLV